MMKYKWLAATVTLAVTVCLGLVIASMIDGKVSYVTLKNGNQIRIGMTEAEVEETIGSKEVFNHRTDAVKTWEVNDKKRFLRVAFDVNTRRVRWTEWSNEERP
jgi:hypothetical protein